jgi:hypothetical protein
MISSPEQLIHSLRTCHLTAKIAALLFTHSSSNQKEKKTDVIKID